jgi:hypothetical protein
LKDLLAVHSWESLVELLEVFFASDASFIKRQDYSLGAFATSINILKAIRSKPKPLHLKEPQAARHSSPGDAGAWAKASEIAAGKITK